MNIFSKVKTYSFDEIVSICIANSLTTVDCLKDENMISVEEFINSELGGECLFEFNRLSEDSFLLRWSIFKGEFCEQSTRK